LLFYDTAKNDKIKAEMNDLGLSPLFSDAMIIQRDAAFPLWSRQKVTVTFLGKTYESKNVDGRWLVTLDPAEAGGPYTMKIVSDNFSAVINDIYLGDLWLCAGQSNMEMQMEYLRDDFGEEWTAVDFPPIRQFKTPQEWDFSSPRDELPGGCWLKASKENLHEFSGTAWFFAKNLYEKYHIPIGLINTAWGGTPIEAWMSEDALASFPEKIAEGRQYADSAMCEEIAKNTNAAIAGWETCLRNEDRGLAEGWQKPKTDISGWKDIHLPGDFTDVELERFCGVIWLAKDFEVTSDFAAKDTKICLGMIVDADTAYINGVETGNTEYRYPPRKYASKGLFKEGKNRIVIRVTCNNGEGGVTRGKPFRIFTDNESVELSGIWKYKTGAAVSERPAEFCFHYKPMGNYNAMIAPVLKYPLKGVIWYQGESNDQNPHEYARLFRLMIQDWRKKNGNDELPFLFVQLPIWKDPSDNDENSSWATIREAQKSVLCLPATGMAAALDLGEWNDIHPINKKDVGFRLFLAAEKIVFKKENSSPGPILRGFERRQEKLYLYFDNCGDGLRADGEKPHVSVIYKDGQTRLSAEIEGKDVICIDISAVKNPQKILYAWADNPHDRQLFNSDGLPVIPFKIKLTEGENRDV
jgi:sialate O-acetylesterase